MNWTPWGQMPSTYERAMTAPQLIGLTGTRNVGKTTTAEILEEEFGFTRIHAFDGGKEAAYAYFEYVTRNPDRARRMVWGDLKDKPCDDLPGGVAPRFFLERFGKFMGVDMGIDWTLAMEIKRARAMSPDAPIVVESVVYEAPWFRAQGGVVVRLQRPDFTGPVGIESDAAQGDIVADITITAATVAELGRKVREFMRGDVRRAA
jgi:hypothetical protein